MLQRRYTEADDLVKSLPAQVRDHPEIRILSAHLGFIRAAQDVPPADELHRVIHENPDDLDARYQLCAVNVAQDKYEEAMQQLLEIVRRDSANRRQAGRDGLLASFSLLGVDDERVRRYRVLLDQAAH